MTLSPALSPDRIVQSFPIQSPVLTGRACALPSASTTNTRLPFSVWTTAACGTRNTLSRSPAVMRTVTNWPGQKLLARIVEFGAQLLRAEPRIDRGRREVEAALERIRRTRRAAAAPTTTGVAAVEAASGQLGEIRLGEAEAHPDGGHLIDRREQAAVGVGRDQRADRMLGAPADAGDRRRHSRIRKIELGLPNRRHWPVESPLPRAARDEVESSYSLRLTARSCTKRLQPRLLAPRLVDLRAVACASCALRLRQRDLVRCAIDFEQQRALFHEVAFVVELLLQDPGNPRAHLDLLRSLDLSHDVEPDRDLSRLDLEHAGRRSGAAALAAGAAASRPQAASRQATSSAAAPIAACQGSGRKNGFVSFSNVGMNGKRRRARSRPARKSGIIIQSRVYVNRAKRRIRRCDEPSRNPSRRGSRFSTRRSASSRAPA